MRLIGFFHGFIGVLYSNSPLKSCYIQATKKNSCMIKPVTAMNTLQSNPITQSDIDDVNVQSIQPLVTPAELKKRVTSD